MKIRLTSVASSALFLLAAALPAAAADMVEPSADMVWSGFYAGAQIGVNFAGDLDALRADTDGDGVYNAITDPAIITFEDQNDDLGFLGGLHAGYDASFGAVVLGAVVDVSYANSTFNTFVDDGVDTAGISRKVGFVGTARARAGYAAGRVLVYATGGLAVADVDKKLFSTIDFSARNPVVEGDDTLFGYTVGGGLDVGITRDVSLGAEYLYTSLDDAAATARTTIGQSLAIRSGDEINFHRITAKVSYHFE